MTSAWLETSELHGPAFVDSEPVRLVVVGAVELAAALCRLARAVGWRPYVVDPRPRFARAERFPEAEEVLVAWPSEAFARLGGLDSSCAVVVVTHDPVLDDGALALALSSEAMFVGAMGSRRNQAGRRERLAAAGVTEAELDRLCGPLGLDLGARTAAETALSVLGEIVAVRHGREGGRLVAGGGSIRHAPAAS